MSGGRMRCAASVPLFLCAAAAQPRRMQPQVHMTCSDGSGAIAWRCSRGTRRRGRAGQATCLLAAQAAKESFIPPARLRLRQRHSVQQHSTQGAQHGPALLPVLGAKCNTRRPDRRWGRGKAWQRRGRRTRAAASASAQQDISQQLRRSNDQRARGCLERGTKGFCSMPVQWRAPSLIEWAECGAEYGLQLGRPPCGACARAPAAAHARSCA
jgi:hypothetical protein